MAEAAFITAPYDAHGYDATYDLTDEAPAPGAGPAAPGPASVDTSTRASAAPSHAAGETLAALYDASVDFGGAATDPTTVSWVAGYERSRGSRAGAGSAEAPDLTLSDGDASVAAGLAAPPQLRHAGSSVHARSEAHFPTLAIDESASAWHEEYQRLVETPATTAYQQRDRAESIAAFQRKFAEQCCATVVTLVNERRMPAAERSIAPVAAGGVAGGDKFIVDGVFYKLQDDASGMYGGKVFAAKAAGHELKSAARVVGAIGSAPGCSNLHVPLSAVLDYAGVRCVAQTLVPGPAGGRLAYGTADAGATVVAEEAMTELVVPLAAALNVKAHKVSGTTVHTAADVEGRVGSDGRRYVMDLARFFPPTHDFARTCLARVFAVATPPGASESIAEPERLAPLPLPSDAAAGARLMAAIVPLLGVSGPAGVKCLAGPSGDMIFVAETAVDLPVNAAATVAIGAVRAGAGAGEVVELRGTVVWVRHHAMQGRRPHLWRLMRPEAVEASETPLNADAFCGFGSGDPGFAADNAAVSARTRRLLADGVPFAAAALDAHFSGAATVVTGAASAEDLTPAALSAVKDIVHKHGCNLRWLGRIRRKCANETARAAVLCEMIARATRRLVNLALEVTGTAAVDDGAKTSARLAPVAASLCAGIGVPAAPDTAGIAGGGDVDGESAASDEGGVRLREVLWSQFEQGLTLAELAPPVAGSGRGDGIWPAHGASAGAGRTAATLQPHHRYCVLARALELSGVVLTDSASEVTDAYKLAEQPSPLPPLTADKIKALIPRPKHIARIPFASAERSDADALASSVSALKAELSRREGFLGDVSSPALLPLLADLADLLRIKHDTIELARATLMRAVSICRADVHAAGGHGHSKDLEWPAEAPSVAGGGNEVGRSDDAAEAGSAGASGAGSGAGGDVGAAAAAAPAAPAAPQITREAASSSAAAATAAAAPESSPALSRARLRLAFHLQHIAEFFTADEGATDDAVEAMRESVAIHMAEHGRESGATAWALRHLADVIAKAGHKEAGLVAYRTASDAMRAAYTENSLQYGLTRTMIGNILNDHGEGSELDAAEEEFRKGYDICCRAAPDHPDVSMAANDLGMFLLMRGDVDEYEGRMIEAEMLLNEALDIRRRDLGDTHPLTAGVLNNLGQLKQAMGELDEASAALEEAVAIRSASLGVYHSDHAQSLLNLGNVYQDLRALDRAVAAYTRARDVLLVCAGPRDPRTLSTAYELGQTFGQMGRLDEARRMFQECLELSEPRGLGHARALAAMGRLKEARGDVEGALTDQREAMQIAREKVGERHELFNSLRSNLANALLRAGHVDEAATHMREAHSMTETMVGRDHPSFATSCMNLAVLCATKLGRMDEARELMETAKGVLERTLGTEHPTYVTCINNMRAMDHAPNGPQIGDAGGGGGPVDLEARLAPQLEALASMGLTDKEANIRALSVCRGDVEAAIGMLLG